MYTLKLCLLTSKRVTCYAVHITVQTQCNTTGRCSVPPQGQLQYKHVRAELITNAGSTCIAAELGNPLAHTHTRLESRCAPAGGRGSTNMPCSSATHVGSLICHVTVKGKHTNTSCAPCTHGSDKPAWRGPVAQHAAKGPCADQHAAVWCCALTMAAAAL